MKKLTIFLLLLTLLGCKKHVKLTNVKEISKINGIFYKIENKDKYTGIIEEYSIENPSILIARANIKEGLLNGSVEGFYINGKIKFSQQYKEGVLDGKTIGYSEKGTPIYERNFKNGKTEGSYKVYYDNGQLQYEENYTNNKINGEAFSYNSDGKLENKKTFENGILKEEKNYIDASNDDIKFIFRIDGNQSRVMKQIN